MMYMCGTRFEIEEKELDLIRSLSSQDPQEEATIEEEKSDQKEEFEPISDQEEGEEGPQRSLIEASHKRHQSISSDLNDQMNGSGQEGEGVDLPLQPRLSGRAWKRPKGLDGFELS